MLKKLALMTIGSNHNCQRLQHMQVSGCKMGMAGGGRMIMGVIQLLPGPGVMEIMMV